MKKTRSHLVIILAMALVLAPAYLAAQGSQSADVLFGAALHQEEVAGDYEAAIETYKKLLAEYPDNRPLAARAQFRIGICYEKLGLKEAENAFQKVVDNYPDQAEIVKAAKEKLSILQKARAIIEKKDKGIKMTEIPIDPEKNAYSFISPDGKKLAYVSVLGDIWVSDIASGKDVQLTQTPAFDYWCFWSPDSQKIAYLDASNNLYVVSAQGGPPKTLIKMDADFIKEKGGFFPTSWSPDSQEINCWIFKKGLFAIPISGGEWKDVFKYSSPEQEEVYYGLLLSPNEEYLAYSENSGNKDIYIMPADGGESAQITNHPAQDLAYQWSYDGRWLLFMSNRNGKDEPWIIGISPDGKREGEPFQIPFLLTTDVTSFSWTKDGQIGLFCGKIISNLFVANSDGDEEIQLTKMECGEWEPKWSPDNKYIAYISDRGGNRDIWIVPVQGGEPKMISG
ncbi:MAG: PD40 domain-containing protein, partial [Candidatus Aminicenantes bacterium]|nr:PD40 domain-containing protein [Candidatus Aminicenantes bacterium]